MSFTRFFAGLLLLCMLPLAACGQTAPKPVQEGVDYEVLTQGQRWQKPDGRIEVVEVFAYWCPHCDDFQSMVDAWKRTMPADVRFSYVPAAFDPEDTYASAYFAVERAGAVPKLHQAIFDAIHRQGMLPHSNPTYDELGTWFGQRGLNRSRMVGLLSSAEVAAQVQAARRFMIANHVKSTPTLVVNGKYVVRAARQEDRFRVVDALLAMERAAMARGAAAPAAKKTP